MGHAILARDMLDEREEPPHDVLCAGCDGKYTDTTDTTDTTSTFYYCEDCFPPHRKCAQCLIRSHHEHPFHRIRAWDAAGGFWRSVDLGDLGYEMSLEHGGDRCPDAPSEPRDFVVVHDHGVSRLPIVYCSCKDAPPATTQLMRAGLWPATWEKPRSVITLQALKIFDSLSVNAHTTAHDFIRHLERLSDVVAPDEVKVRHHYARICTHAY